MLHENVFHFYSAWIFGNVCIRRHQSWLALALCLFRFLIFILLVSTAVDETLAVSTNCSSIVHFHSFSFLSPNFELLILLFFIVIIWNGKFFSFLWVQVAIGDNYFETYKTFSSVQTSPVFFSVSTADCCMRSNSIWIIFDCISMRQMHLVD